MVWSCSICSVFSAIALKTLVRHITLQHASHPNFSIKCGVNGCQEQYKKMDSFRKHLHRKHAEEMANCDRANKEECILPQGNNGNLSSGEESDPGDVYNDFVHQVTVIGN